jgi:hypothetical protein
MFIGGSVDAVSTAKGAGFGVTALEAVRAPVESIVIVNGTIAAVEGFRQLEALKSWLEM